MHTKHIRGTIKYNYNDDRFFFSCSLFSCRRLCAVLSFLFYFWLLILCSEKSVLAERTGSMFDFEVVVIDMVLNICMFWVFECYALAWNKWSNASAQYKTHKKKDVKCNEWYKH